MQKRRRRWQIRHISHLTDLENLADLADLGKSSKSRRCGKGAGDGESRRSIANLADAEKAHSMSMRLLSSKQRSPSSSAASAATRRRSPSPAGLPGRSSGRSPNRAECVRPVSAPSVARHIVERTSRRATISTCRPTQRGRWGGRCWTAVYWTAVTGRAAVTMRPLECYHAAVTILHLQ